MRFNLQLWKDKYVQSCGESGYLEFRELFS